jgi:hypothetical protein
MKWTQKDDLVMCGSVVLAGTDGIQDAEALVNTHNAAIDAVASAATPTDDDAYEITQRTMSVLRSRYAASVEKYGPMKSAYEAMGVLDGEVHEVRLALHARAEQAIYDEFADVANTCIRWMCEMERQGLA